MGWIRWENSIVVSPSSLTSPCFILGELFGDFVEGRAGVEFGQSFFFFAMFGAQDVADVY